MIVAAERLTLPLEERTHRETIAALKRRLIDAGHSAFAACTGSRTARSISSVYAIIRAPWAQSRTVRAEHSYDHEEYVSGTMITDLAQRALDEAHVPRANFLEASVMQVALNGYATSDPEGKYAHKTEVATLVSVADPSLRSAVREALGTVFPAARVVMHSGARGILEALRGVDPEKRDRLVLDVAQEGTAAIVMRDGVVESEAYVAEGERSMLTRALPKRPSEETLGSLRMIAREECDSSTCSDVENGLAKMEPDLAHVFGEFFATIGTPHRLPNAITLLAHPDLAPWLTRFFSRIDFAQFTEVSQPFEITPFKARYTVPTDAHEGPESTDTDLLIVLALINKQQQRR